ncbi:hypothetical protein A2U01_0004773, partial [Trifolium medium]|nr:hypothetical protein [Trifolium medium]
VLCLIFKRFVLSFGTSSFWTNGRAVPRIRDTIVLGIEFGRFVLAFGTSPLLDQRDELVPHVRDTIVLGFLSLDGLFSRSECHRCWTRKTNWYLVFGTLSFSVS